MKKETRGGFRVGAGRKPAIVPKGCISIYLPYDLLEIIKPMKERSVLIEKLLRKHFKK